MGSWDLVLQLDILPGLFFLSNAFGEFVSFQYLRKGVPDVRSKSPGAAP